MKRKEIKAAARKQLGSGIFKNNWLLALLVLVIGAALTYVAGIFCGIGTILVAGPINYALAKMFLKQSRDNEKMKIGEIFDGFKDDYGGTLILDFLKGLFVVLWSLLLVVPGLIKSYSYAMATYIKADHPEYGWKQCITESRKMMNGNKWKLFIQDLSFIGWYIVGGICFGVGTLWVNAYYTAARSQFYLSLVKEAE